MTFRQAIELNAHVHKGETGSLVVYANAITRTERDEKTGEDVEREIPYLKGYTVFNVEQIDGLPDHYYAKAAPQLDPVARIDRAEKFFADCKATIRHGGNRAYYAQEIDYVQMPPFESFRDAESYYSTLAHEMTHWTKHPSRLARDLGRKLVLKNDTRFIFKAAAHAQRAADYLRAFSGTDAARAAGEQPFSLLC